MAGEKANVAIGQVEEAAKSSRQDLQPLFPISIPPPQQLNSHQRNDGNSGSESYYPDGYRKEHSGDGNCPRERHQKRKRSSTSDHGDNQLNTSSRKRNRLRLRNVSSNDSFDRNRSSRPGSEENNDRDDGLARDYRRHEHIRELPSLPKVILVLDTNILLEKSGLRFLERLSEGRFDDLTVMQVFISHMVFLELDRQKRRFPSTVAYKSGQAIRFLHDAICDSKSCETSQTNSAKKRIIGQTAREFTQAGDEFHKEIDDDHVLFCCLQVQAAHRKTADSSPDPQPVVWCLTNDRNLRVRTVVNGVPAFSMDDVLDNLDRKKQGQTSVFDSIV